MEGRVCQYVALRFAQKLPKNCVWKRRNGRGGGRRVGTLISCISWTVSCPWLRVFILSMEDRRRLLSNFQVSILGVFRSHTLKPILVRFQYGRVGVVSVVLSLHSCSFSSQLCDSIALSHRWKRNQIIPHFAHSVGSLILAAMLALFKDLLHSKKLSPPRLQWSQGKPPRRECVVCVTIAKRRKSKVANSKASKPAVIPTESRDLRVYSASRHGRVGKARNY